MLDDIQKRNRDFLARGKELRLPPPGSRPRLLVVACSCPELNGVLNASLGLVPGEAFIIRVAGAWGGRQAEELLRSVAVALEYLDVPSLLVLGHHDCRCLEASSLQAQRVLSRLSRGEADGDEPAMAVEGWPPTAAEAVAETVRRLRPLVSEAQGGEIRGGILELPSGRLELLPLLESIAERPELATEAAATDNEPNEPRQVAEADLPPLPPLPEIPLPEIPEVPIAAPDPQPAPAAPRKPKFTYGQVPGAGPVALSAFSAQPASGEEKVSSRKAAAGASLRPTPSVKAARSPAPAGGAAAAPSPPAAAMVPRATRSGETVATDLLSALPQIKRVMWQNLPMEHIQSIRRDVRSAIDANRSSSEIVTAFISGLTPLGQKRQLIRNELNMLQDVLAGTEEEFVASVMEGLLD